MSFWHCRLYFPLALWRPEFSLYQKKNLATTFLHFHIRAALFSSTAFFSCSSSLFLFFVVFHSVWQQSSSCSSQLSNPSRSFATSRSQRKSSQLRQIAGQFSYSDKEVTNSNTHKFQFLDYSFQYMNILDWLELLISYQDVVSMPSKQGT